jgi:hypothetical protein
MALFVVKPTPAKGEVGIRRYMQQALSLWPLPLALMLKESQGMEVELLEASCVLKMRVPIVVAGLCNWWGSMSCDSFRPKDPSAVCGLRASQQVNNPPSYKILYDEQFQPKPGLQPSKFSAISTPTSVSLWVRLWVLYTPNPTQLPKQLPKNLVSSAALRQSHSQRFNNSLRTLSSSLLG